MKNKKKLIKRIGALLCAIVVAVSGMGGTYYASSLDDWFDMCVSNKNAFIGTPDFEYSLPLEHLDTYSHMAVFCDDSRLYVLFSNEPIILKFYIGSYRQAYFQFSDMYNSDFVLYSSLSGISWSKEFWSSATFSCANYRNSSWSFVYRFVGSNYDIIGNYNNEIFLSRTMNLDGSPLIRYNSAFGYLQNVRVENQYLRGEVSIGGVDLPLYYDDALDTLKRVWKFDIV